MNFALCLHTEDIEFSFEVCIADLHLKYFKVVDRGTDFYFYLFSSGVFRIQYIVDSECIDELFLFHHGDIFHEVYILFFKV
jgi:hypothetical protein